MIGYIVKAFRTSGSNEAEQLFRFNSFGWAVKFVKQSLNNYHKVTIKRVNTNDL